MEFTTIRRYYILISQLLGAAYCIYFIINVKNYEISWRALRWIMPDFANSIDSLLSSIGTLILIIPLTIIIMSLLMPESYKLRIASTFFGIASTFFGTASTLFLTISGFFNNTYNMGIFMITRVLTLEEKGRIFKLEYLDLIENFRPNLMLLRYFQEKMLEKY